MPTPKHTVKNTSAEIRAAFEKIVVNAGIGRASGQGNFEDKVLPQISRDLALVAGQKPQVCRARRSIAGFKTREGQIIGLKVTLRGAKMVDFFERLTTTVLPRVRDFRGLDPRIVDEGGSLNIGFREHFVFPEVNPEESPVIFSLGVTVVPRHRSREQALTTYEKMGIPFKKM